jgi:uncharacterized membrane protein YfcA
VDLTPFQFGLLWAAAFLAGFVDSIAGGGGIITVPVLLAMGLDPHVALGTNKLQACFGSCTASIHYIRGNLVTLRETVTGICFTAVGAAVGAAAIQMVEAPFLKLLLPVLLMAIFLYMLFSPDAGKLDRRPVMHPSLFYIAAGVGLGFYDGFFGPGTGSFWTIAFVVFLGQNLKKATAHTKVMNATSNLISLAAFLIGGKVLFFPGLLMGTGQLLGATLGSHMVLNKGVRFVRAFFLGVVALTIAKVIHSAYFS